jgi:hypothetical protein
MAYFEFFITFFITLAILRCIPHLMHKRTRTLQPRLSYSRIADLEIELYGHTFACEGSPYAEDSTSLFNVDDTGHMPNGQCNLNHSIGEVCRDNAHLLASYGYGVSVFTYPGDPNWIDDDGRPW